MGVESAPEIEAFVSLLNGRRSETSRRPLSDQTVNRERRVYSRNATRPAFLDEAFHGKEVTPYFT